MTVLLIKNAWLDTRALNHRERFATALILGACRSRLAQVAGTSSSSSLISNPPKKNKAHAIRAIASYVGGVRNSYFY